MMPLTNLKIPVDGIDGVTWTCDVCGKEKPVTEMYKNSKGGYYYVRRLCHQCRYKKQKNKAASGFKPKEKNTVLTFEEWLGEDESANEHKAQAKYTFYVAAHKKYNKIIDLLNKKELDINSNAGYIDTQLKERI